ncbi:MAG: glycosyltransferase family 2 protein [Candidatus Woesearchaeota archaeon]|nr:glycosyltransferase family 2 protein [Candidatus Woesearchaeota archaeon]
MISIIIPCYNEEKRIGKTLEAITSFMKGRKHEIILVDDGSTDKTISIAKRFKVKILKNHKNMGKGYSVKRGALNSSGEYILFSDADLSTPIEELDNLLEQDSDIVIGSRKADGAIIEAQQPNLRVLAGNIFPFITRLLILPGIKDTQCGFKLFKRKCLKIFRKQTVYGFSFDVELLYLARKYGFSVKEVGVRWSNDINSKVSIIRHSFSMFKDLIRIRMNDAKGRY